jgi:hypothetical protein
MLWWSQICKVHGWSREDQDGDAVGEHGRTGLASVLDSVGLIGFGSEAGTCDCDAGGVDGEHHSFRKQWLAGWFVWM